MIVEIVPCKLLSAIDRVLNAGATPTWWVIATILAITIAVSFGVYYRESVSSGKCVGLSMLRAIALLIIVWMLWEWSVVRFHLDLPELWIVIDESSSMLERDEPERRSRIEVAQELIEQRNLRKRLSDRFELHFFAIGDGPSELPSNEGSLESKLTGEHLKSRLGDDLKQLLSRNQAGVAALWLFSDGRTTEGCRLSDVQSGLPIFVTPLGSETRAFDLELCEARATSLAIPGDFVDISVNVTATAYVASGYARLLNEQNQLLDEQAIDLTKDLRQQLKLGAEIKESGLHRWKVVVGTQTTESDESNNELEVSVYVREQPLQILLIAYSPNYEFRFLKHLLERTSFQESKRPLLKLTTVLQQADPRYTEQDRTAIKLPPIDLEQLRAFDVAIFLDADPEGLGRLFLERIADQVDRHGMGLLVGGGPQFLPGQLAGTPLAELLPVDLSYAAVRPAFGTWHLEPTSFGMTERFIQLPGEVWRRMPAIHFLSLVDSVRRPAQVLLVGDPTNGRSLPAIISHRVGAGSVTLHLTDEFYRLSSFAGDDRGHEWFWLQSIRRLAKGRAATDADHRELHVEPSLAELGEPIELSLQLGTQLVDSELEKTEAEKRGAEPKGARIEVRLENMDTGNSRNQILRVDSRNLNYWSATANNFEAGRWRLSLTSAVENPARTPAAYFIVKAPLEEKTRVDADHEAIRSMAQSSGGAVLVAGESVANWLKKLPQSVKAHRQPAGESPLWNHWLALVALVGTLSTEWFLRRWWGMV